MDSKRIIPIRFPSEVWRLVQKHTKAEGLGASTWIRMLVIRELRLLYPTFTPRRAKRDAEEIL